MSKHEKSIVPRIRFVRRRFPLGHRLFRGPFEPVPLINVVLLLVLFLLLHMPFVLQPGIVVNLPTSSFAEGAPYGAMVVTISQEGMVFFNDERTTMEGLGLAFSQAAFEHPDAPLVIEADGRVAQSTIVAIYNMAMSAGLKKVVISTRLSSAPRTRP